MQAISESNRTPAIVVIPHFLTAAVVFLLLTILIYIAAGSFTGHYFQPGLLALTHLAALGWGTMIIFGALYQFLPVILDTRLYSTRLALITYLLLLPGLSMLVPAFWNFSTGIWLQAGGVLILAALSLFSLNIYLTTRSAKLWSIEADFILTSCIWLLSTGLLGLVLVFNLNYAFLPEDHLTYLKLHAHLGMAGWFIMLICGVGSRLIPMFMVSGKLNKTKLNIAFYCLNASLLAFATDTFFINSSRMYPLYLIIACIGLGAFLLYIRDAYRSRLRKKLDAGMKQSLLALFLILIPVILSLTLSLTGNAEVNGKFYTTYGLSVFLGFITALILGQTFKTLPFIVWLELKKGSSRHSNLLPKDLYGERLVRWQSYLYLVAFTLLLTGIIGESLIVTKAGSVIMILTALLYLLNVSLVISYLKPAKS